MPISLGKKDISAATRLRVVLCLAERSVRGKLLRGAVCAAMSEFNISQQYQECLVYPWRMPMTVAVETDAVTSGYRQLYA
ncbi:hypothetical protein JG687_00017028 [Phytophthora cactorum]|uniref:Uncharacterized protein n=1 Tax=Phytophthora cactorum TaxID=29920 RepID=A0A8T1TQE9_9STRA|nr:hypothetical protein PC116_g20828 [Phytophthora cactorum]KAG6945896.1 hypothetical protein JG687_00017028 [Phytophthora cactorum]